MNIQQNGAQRNGGLGRMYWGTWVAASVHLCTNDEQKPKMQILMKFSLLEKNDHNGAENKKKNEKKDELWKLESV